MLNLRTIFIFKVPLKTKWLKGFSFPMNHGIHHMTTVVSWENNFPEMVNIFPFRKIIPVQENISYVGNIFLNGKI